MHSIPCGSLIEAPSARCDLGHAFPGACIDCTDYTPGINAQERQRSEVWARVMGYYRPVSEWNPGKQQEHAQRVYLRERKEGKDDA